MKEYPQNCYVVVQSTMWMCNYASVSLCEEKHAIFSTNLIACFLCEVTGEWVCSFKSVQGIVQNIKWKCKNVHVLIVFLYSNLCTKPWRRTRKLLIFHICIQTHTGCCHPRIQHLGKIFAWRFVYMHIWNAKMKKLYASSNARLLCYSNCQSWFNLWMSLINIPQFGSHS